MVLIRKEEIKKDWKNKWKREKVEPVQHLEITFTRMQMDVETCFQMEEKKLTTLV